MNLLKDINPSRVTPEEFLCVIEIEKYGKNKYELDKETGALIMDRVLFTSTHYPANYGFIPLTLWGDGDPLDVFVYCSQPIQPLSLVKCKAIGSVEMIDNSQSDTKIIAVPFGDPTYSCYNEIEDLPPHLINELIHFLQVYKQLENKTTEIGTFHNSQKAKEQIMQGLANYKKNIS